MNLNFLLIFFLVADLARVTTGDALSKYLEKKLKEFPDWVQENLEDELTLACRGFYKRKALIEYVAKPFNYTTKGLKSAQLRAQPSVYGSLYDGLYDVYMSIMYSLTFEGDSEIHAFLFPDTDRIPLTTSLSWKLHVTVNTFDNYRFHILASANGSISMNIKNFNQEVSESKPGVSVKKLSPEYISSWYGDIVQEGLIKDLSTCACEYNRCPEELGLGMFLGNAFQNLTYFDII